MKKFLLSLAVFLSMNAFSQTTLLSDDFESYPDFIITGIGSWQTLDLDGLNTYVANNPATWANAGNPMAYIVFNFSTSGETNTTSGTEVRNFDPHSGNKYMACWGGVPAGAVTANNDWLISPPVTLGGTGNNLSFWVKSLSNTYGLEKYKVGVYVGSGTPTSASNFTIISGAVAQTAPYPNWGQKTLSLDAYAGQTIRIGIQCVSADVYMFMVDDVLITTTSLSTAEVEARNTKIYPNPTKGLVNIKTTKKIDSVSVFDSAGKKVLNSKNMDIDISTFAKGVYMMTVNFSDGTKVEKKVIKE